MSQSWQNHRPPPGWQGAWPPPAGMAMPPGFPGPPPVPQNVPVPPSSWQAGFWQFNPSAGGSGGTSAIPSGSANTGIRGFPGSQQSSAAGPWAPSNHWAGPPGAQQQSQAFNPYKKQPRPPEAGYYDYKLTDNPLGLEGMEPRREDSSQDRRDGEPKTPWIWNPPTLRESSDRPVAAHDFPRSRSSMDSGPSQSHGRRASMDTQGRDGFRTASAGGQRRASHDVADNSRSFPQHQNPLFATALTSPKIPGFVPNPPHQQSPLSHHHTGPHQPQAHHPVRKSESFTEKMDLHPTFSPQIVRTPDHYHRRNIETTRQGGIYRSSGNEQKTYIPRSQNAIDEMNGTLHTGPSAQPLERQSSLPTSLTSPSSPTTVGLGGFADEPSVLLSPLIGATPQSRHGSLERSRTDPPVGRSQTLSAIPESSSSRRRDVGFVPMRHSSDDPTYAPLQSSRSRNSTPHPRRENPLPAPPVDSQRSTPSRQGRAPVNYSKKIRKGFWNRRGDHLTSDMHIVYAPEGKTYPTELSQYPDGRNGYYDAVTDSYLPWLEERPELPSSLPHRGKPPRHPYESFVSYSYIP